MSSPSLHKPPNLPRKDWKSRLRPPHLWLIWSKSSLKLVAFAQLRKRREWLCERSQWKKESNTFWPSSFEEKETGSSAAWRFIRQRRIHHKSPQIDPEEPRALEWGKRQKNVLITFNPKPKRLYFYPTDISSPSSIRSSRSCPANSPRFEKTLKDLGVRFSRREVQPDKEDLKTILELIQKRRDSPEPDRGEFHETLALVDNTNETMIANRLTPLLIPFRDRPSNKQNTSNLLYRSDSPWPGFGSVYPRLLPVPQPDLVISFSSAAFTAEQQRHMISPYKDEAGFYPGIICEVKTALQGPKVADRQNGNNAICALLADFQFQQKLGHKMEGKIRLVTTAHDTRSQWYTVWFHVLGHDGKPEWCSKSIKHITFDIEEERGFLDARAANLNLCEHLQSVILPQLYEDLAEAAKLGTSSISGAGIQPRLTTTSEPGLQIRTGTQRATDLQLPTAPSSSGEVSSKDLPPSLKRPKFDQWIV